jgi:hypothetical protein
MDPLIIALELEAKLVVIDPEIAVASARYRLRHHLLRFLRQDANVCRIAAIVGETVNAKPVV